MAANDASSGSEDMNTIETRLWCRWCGTPVRVDTESADPVEWLEARAVHISTDEEQCENKRHVAAPTDNPSLCAHDPAPDTAYAVTGLLAKPGLDYGVPVEAKCLVCDAWIRQEQRSVAGPDPVWSLKYPNGEPRQM